MVVQDEERIVTGPDVLGGKPRIAGTRIGIHLLEQRVEEGGDDPATVAESLDLGNVYLRSRATTTTLGRCARSSAGRSRRARRQTP